MAIFNLLPLLLSLFAKAFAFSFSFFSLLYLPARRKTVKKKRGKSSKLAVRIQLFNVADR